MKYEWKCMQFKRNGRQKGKRMAYVDQWQHVLFVPCQAGKSVCHSQVTPWGKTLYPDSRNTRLQQITEASVFLDTQKEDGL